MADQPLPNKNDFVLQPLNDNVPVASTPISQQTQGQVLELEELRRQIEQLNNEAVSLQITDRPNPVVIEASQQHFAEDTPFVPSQKKAAVQIIRDKLAKLYAKEPDATDEAIEAFQAQNNRSKHQTFMYNLTTSGKSLAQIQVEWHEYYAALPNDEKHDVWQEFYTSNNAQSKVHKAATHSALPATERAHHGKLSATHNEPRTTAEIKQQVINKLSANGKLSTKHHIQSLLFGVGIASCVVILFLFSFFNERFIAPFISPSRQVTATPIVGVGTNVGPESKIIIPKINLEVPVVFDINTTAEKDVQAGLEQGVVHYSTSANPGQSGNVVIVGHSSNNILNKGKYKFAFVLLKRLEVGDTISLQKGGVRYTYVVYDKKIVKPTDVGVLGATSKPNSLTLITCDPPGTSINRLVVVAEQISPDPAANTVAAPITPANNSGVVLPGNSPSLWQRITKIF